MTDLAEFKEFLAFKAMKAAAAAAAPDMTGAAAVRTRMAAIMERAAPVRKVDWDRALPACLNYIFVTNKTVLGSPESDWWLWRSIYMSDPSAFVMIGELHCAPGTTDSYISVRYNFPSTPAFATFHLYGTVSGSQFFVTRADWAPTGKAKAVRPLWERRRAPPDSASTVGSEKSAP
jgi:hypothetical protein